MVYMLNYPDVQAKVSGQSRKERRRNYGEKIEERKKEIVREREGGIEEEKKGD